MTTDGFRDFGHEQYFALESQLVDIFADLGEVTETWGQPDLDVIIYDERERMKAAAMLKMLTNIPDTLAVYDARGKGDEGRDLLAQLLELVNQRNEQGGTIDSVYKELREGADPTRQPRRFKLVIDDLSLLEAAGLHDEAEVILHFDDYSTDSDQEFLRCGRIEFIKKPGSTIVHNLKFFEGWDIDANGVGTFTFERYWEDRSTSGQGIGLPTPRDFSEAYLLERDLGMYKIQADEATRAQTLLALYKQRMSASS